MRIKSVPDFNIDKKQRTNQLMEAARADDADYAQIAKQFGVSKVTVFQICAKAGITPPKARRTAALLQRVAALRRQGKTPHEIAETTNEPIFSIAYLIRKSVGEDAATRRCPGVGRQPHHCPVDAFYKDAGRSVGFSSYCKDCHKARRQTYFKRYYQQHRHEIIASVLARRAQKV
jgi:hypothetical protein